MAVEMEACITKGGEGTVADDARVGDVAQTCLEGVTLPAPRGQG